MKYDLVVVEWEDATNVAEWADIEEAIAFNFSFDYHVRNVGYMIRNDDECVIVAGRCTDDSKAVGLVERIPKSMVRALKVLIPGDG